MLFPNMEMSLRSRCKDIASHCSRVCRTTEGNTRQCGFPAKFIQRLALDASQMHTSEHTTRPPHHLVSRARRHHPRIGDAAATSVIGIPHQQTARRTNRPKFLSPAAITKNHNIDIGTRTFGKA